MLESGSNDAFSDEIVGDMAASYVEEGVEACRMNEEKKQQGKIRNFNSPNNSANDALNGVHC